MDVHPGGCNKCWRHPEKLQALSCPAVVSDLRLFVAYGGCYEVADVHYIDCIQQLHSLLHYSDAFRSRVTGEGH